MNGGKRTPESILNLQRLCTHQRRTQISIPLAKWTKSTNRKKIHMSGIHKRRSLADNPTNANKSKNGM